MAVYKINEVDADGKIRIAHVVELPDDAAVIARALSLRTRFTMHIWDGPRFVASVPPGAEPPALHPSRPRRRAEA